MTNNTIQQKREQFKQTNDIRPAYARETVEVKEEAEKPKKTKKASKED